MMFEQPGAFDIDGVQLRLRSDSDSEQYDAYIGERQVGYLRIQSSFFSVRCPDAEGELRYLDGFVYGDSTFTPEERGAGLRQAVWAIQQWFKEQEGG